MPPDPPTLPVAAAAAVAPPPAPPAPHWNAAPVAHRLLAALVAALALALLLVAAGLTPNPAGHGTHAALGLPPCGMVLATGLPCPTCGMTTAFAHAARGDLPASFLAQPMGFLLALSASCAVWIGLYAAATGARVGSILSRMVSPRLLWVLAGLTVAAWLYKIGVWPSAPR